MDFGKMSFYDQLKKKGKTCLKGKTRKKNDLEWGETKSI